VAEASSEWGFGEKGDVEQAHFADSQFWRAGLRPVIFWQVGVSSPQIRQPLYGIVSSQRNVPHRGSCCHDRPGLPLQVAFLSSASLKRSSFPAAGPIIGNQPSALRQSQRNNADSHEQLLIVGGQVRRIYSVCPRLPGIRRANASLSPPSHLASSMEIGTRMVVAFAPRV